MRMQAVMAARAGRSAARLDTVYCHATLRR
jgi:hypothetical protein